MLRGTRMTLLVLVATVLGCHDAKIPLAPVIDTPLAAINDPGPSDTRVDTRDVAIDLAFGTVTAPGAPVERYGAVSALLTASLAEAVREHGPFPGSEFDQVINGFIGSLNNQEFFAADLDFLGDPVDRLVALYNNVLANAAPALTGKIEITSLGAQSYNLAFCDDGSEFVFPSDGVGDVSCSTFVTQGTATINFYRVDLALVWANPQVVDDCKKGGWKNYGFRNQGQCIRFVNTGKDSRVS